MLSMLILAACGDDTTTDTAEENVMTIANYNVSFTFPSNWKQEEDQAPYDLQFGNSKSYASVFAYFKTDLADGASPMTLYDVQKDDILSKRTDIKVESEAQIREINGKRIKSGLYTAAADGVKNSYYCNLIEFGEDADAFAWVIFTALPSDTPHLLDEWDAILASATWEQP